MCVGVWVCLKEDMVYLFPAAVAPVLVALTILSLVCSGLMTAGMPFCYLYACVQSGHVTTIIVSTTGLMTEEMAVYWFVKLLKWQTSIKDIKNVTRCNNSRTATSRKQGRDDSIKHTTSYISFRYAIMENGVRWELYYTELFYAIVISYLVFAVPPSLPLLCLYWLCR